MKMILFLSLLFAFLSSNNIFLPNDKNIHGIFNSVEKSDFDGLWINENPETRNITRCNISAKGKSLTVQMWGACQPQNCNWGENIANGIEKDATHFELLWDQRFAETIARYEMIEGKLQLTTIVSFKDNSGRQGFTVVEYFTKK